MGGWLRFADSASGIASRAAGAGVALQQRTALRTGMNRVSRETIETVEQRMKGKR